MFEEDDAQHLCVIRTRRRDQLMSHLTRAGIGSDIYYPVVDSCQEVWKHYASYPDLPHTFASTKEVLALPCFPELDRLEVLEIAQVVNEWPIES